MNQKLAIAFCVLFSISASFAQDAQDSNVAATSCDRMLDSMYESCKGVRETVVKAPSDDKNDVCCKNARYNLCTQGVKSYITASKAIKKCEESFYESKIEDLENNAAMGPIKTQCEDFDTKTCVTTAFSNAWGSISEAFSSKNFNDAMGSVGDFFKNLTTQTQEGASSLATRLSGLLPKQQNNNQYTVDGSQDSSSTFSFNKLFNSLQPQVEVIPKDGDNAKKQSESPILDSIKNVFNL